MANPEHLKILQQGVEVWNRWRKEHPEMEPDLNWANLSRIDLSGVNFDEVHLKGTHLQSTKLTRAKLTRANFQGANLRGANLVKTTLIRTNFREATLQDVDLSGAILYETLLGNTVLVNVRGLESCNHYGPSLDHRTLMTAGNLPVAFLRGCGLPENLITYLPSLLNESIQLYSIFISYSHRDEPFARRLYDALQGRGVRCWYAPEDIRGGKKIHEQIDEAIRIYDKLLLVISEHSMQSQWVKTEIRRARKAELTTKRRKLFPVRLVSMEAIQEWTFFNADIGEDLDAEVRGYFIPDFSNWKDHDSFEKAFARLLRDLRAEETAPSP